MFHELLAQLAPADIAVPNRLIPYVKRTRDCTTPLSLVLERATIERQAVQRMVYELQTVETEQRERLALLELGWTFTDCLDFVELRSQE